MIHKALIFLLIATLAACGVDGEPTKPTVGASIGVSSSGNVHSNVGVGVRQGPFSVFFGL